MSITQENINLPDEEDESGDKIIMPFDPSEIKMDTQTVNLGYLLEMLQFDEINLLPDFQRSDDLWSDKQKSRLIESILLGLPLPSFYFNVEENGKWAVIDGLQRLGTLKKFIIEKNEKDKFILNDLEFLLEYNGKKYNDLSREDKRRISGLKITLNIIQKSTPVKVKYIIFRRVNTAGLQLTPQEMRHALNQGIPAKFIKELSETDEFKRATSKSISSKRMEDRDFVNRFIAFYLLDFNTQYEGELDNFLNEGMAALYNLSNEKLNKIKKDFINAMNLAYEIFGIYAFRKRYDINNTYRFPVSKAVFDSLSVNFAYLSEDQKDILKKNKDLFVLEMIKLFNDREFNNAITSGTGKKQSIQTRFNKVKYLINKIVENDN